MKKHILLICTFSIFLLILVCLCLLIDKNALLNLVYAFISALFGAIIVLLFLDSYYKLKQEQELKQFNKNLKLKTYSNFIIINNYIKTFLECDPNVLKSMSISIGRIYSETGDVFEDTETYKKETEKLSAYISQIRKQEFNQLKRFDYCICFLRLMKNINIYLNQIIEISQFIPKDNIKIKNLFFDILIAKQNLDRLFDIINSQISIEKYKDYSEQSKSNAVAILETANSLDCYTSTECILRNIEKLLECLSQLCSEKELTKRSIEIKNYGKNNISKS